MTFLRRPHSMKRALPILFVLFGASFARAAEPGANADPTRKPYLVVDPRTIDFDPAGAEPKSFTITHHGTADLVIQRVTPAPDAFGFNVVGAPQGTLAPGQSMPVNVRYSNDGHRKQAFGGIQVWSNDERYPTPENNPT